MAQLPSESTPAIPTIAVSVRPVNESNHSQLTIPLRWLGDYAQWDLLRFLTPADGNCLFHAICFAFYQAYIQQQLRGVYVSRSAIVTALRQELASKLAQRVDVTQANSPRYYDLLHGGNAASFAKEVADYSLPAMQQLLASNQHIGYGYMEYISDQVNKDIYILDGQRQDVYYNNELNLIKGRKSIVLYYANQHYETVGLRNVRGAVETHFSPDHPFIQFLRRRLLRTS